MTDTDAFELMAFCAQWERKADNGATHGYAANAFADCARDIRAWLSTRITDEAEPEASS